MNRWTVRSMWMTLLTFALVLPVAIALAEEGQKEAKPKAIKIGGVYGKLDLTDEQKAQIKAVQDDIRAKIEALKAEEKERIEAILTPEQKQQLEEQKAAEKAAREVEKAARDPEKETRKKVGDDGEGGKPEKNKDAQ